MYHTHRNILRARIIFKKKNRKKEKKMESNTDTLPKELQDLVEVVIKEVCDNEDLARNVKRQKISEKCTLQSGGRDVGGEVNSRKPVESVFQDHGIDSADVPKDPHDLYNFDNSNSLREGVGVTDSDPETSEGLDLLDFPDNFFDVTLHKTKSFRHKNMDLVNEHSYKVKLVENVADGNKTLEDLEKELYFMFSSLLTDIREKYQNTDLVRVFITHDEMVNTNIIVGPDYLGNMTVDVIMEKISSVIRSNAFIPADRGLKINVAAVRNLRGSKYTMVSNLHNDLHKKRSVINIENKDGLCLPRAIAVAVARDNHLKNPQDISLKKIFQTMKKKDRNIGSAKRGQLKTLQKKTALHYMEKAFISPDSVGLLEHIPKYEDALGVSINVISARGGNKRVYRSSKLSDCTIYLYHLQSSEYNEGHFAVICKITGLLNRSYYCNNCDKGFNNRKSHKCSEWCNICGRSQCLPAVNSTVKVICQECNAFCRSEICLRKHKTKQGKSDSSMCDTMLFCPKCFISLHGYRTKNYPLERHVCGEAFCNNCRKMYVAEEDNHKCYMRSVTSKKEKTSGKCRRFIFYDFESMVTANGTHIPNLVIARSVCEECGNTDGENMETCPRCGSRCDICSDNLYREPCNTCGLREVVFRGPDTVNLFCKWLFSDQHQNVTVVAHNARSYDNYFLYRYLIENSIVPEVIFNGCKIMYCRVKGSLNIKLLDSLNFLPMPLARLPKSFGLKELKKGYFPHLYNTEENNKDPTKMHLETLPAPYYYDFDNMSIEKREDFLLWYDVRKNDKFDMQSELEDYCRSDVDILLNACWKFRNLYIEATGPENPIDPFDYVTIASLCMGTFRAKFLPEVWDVLLSKDAVAGCFHRTKKCGCVWTEARKLDGDAPLEINNGDGLYIDISADVVESIFQKSDIAVVPVNGYARRDNYSNEAMEWLAYMELEMQKQMGDPELKIRHAFSPDGEKVVCYRDSFGRERKFRLDGYFIDRGGISHALEFNGCWYHGCPSCYPTQRTEITLQGRNLQQRHRLTCFKEKKLKELGYTVHSEWSCGFELMKKKLPENLLPKFTPRKNLQLRDAYTGGRTNAIALMEEFKEKNSKGGYLDFCSLYPYVLKYNRYPVGHPERVVENFLPVVEKRCKKGLRCPIFDTTDCFQSHKYLQYFGIVMCTILPPKKLYFPVLPLRVKGKLMFPLCARCAEEENQKKPCMCTDELRQISGTWCTPEVNVALSLGYKIVNINEVLSWGKSEEMDRESGFGGLFTKYVNMFLKMKTQASGFPEKVKSENEKEEYIKRYNEREQVLLEKSKIEKNPGLRSIGKLALNSFYGKFGQRTNMKKTVFITEYAELYRHLSDVTKVVQDFHVLEGNMVVLEYITNPDLMEADSKTNVNIASFCTSYARLKLWRTLFKLGRRVLYHDTDSVIFTYFPLEWKPTTDQYLGDLTDELSCKELGCGGCVKGHWITDFISCGPKNYAFKTNTGEVVCKVRGFSLNYNASQTINLESMKESLIAWKNNKEGPDLVTVKSMILRKKLNAVIYSSKMEKKYSVVYNKRAISDTFYTIPYGY